MASKDYIRRNREWLSAKATEDGVRLLSDGVYYKVLSGGDASGKHPSPTSIVTVHYTGRTIDGKEFDSSIGGCPPAMRLNSLINGWIVALRQMCGATNGRYTFLRKWDMAVSHSPVYLVVPR